MTAVIRMNSYKLQLDVKERLIDGAGYVRIVDVNGNVYETHLSNVVFISERGKHED